MSKQIDKESTESQSSRDIILSRYQNVKNLLVSKNKLPSINIVPRPVEKLQSPKNNLNQISSHEEDDIRLNEVIALCLQIQNRRKERITPKIAVVHNIFEKPCEKLYYFEENIKKYYCFTKPKIPLVVITENTLVLEFKCLQKPKIYGFYCETSSKIFTVAHKVYQIMEFKEEKKNNKRTCS